MNFKIKYLLTSLIIILLFMIGVTKLNNKDENLNSEIAAITTNTKSGKPAVLIVVDYKWSKMPIRISKDTLRIEWTKGWEVDEFSISINEKDVTHKFYNDFNKGLNEISLQLNSNGNFLSKENFRGEIILVPENISKIEKLVYSSANIQYSHKSLFGRITKSDSVGWENKSVFKID